MRKILISTHGEYAIGLMRTARFFISEQFPIEAISAYVTDLDLKVQLKQYFDKCSEEDEVIVLTDLSGGSVNRECMAYLTRPHTHIISGANLSMILELSFLNKQFLEIDDINEIIKKTQNSIVYVNEIKTYFDDNDE